jgi:hypothetical protein
VRATGAPLNPSRRHPSPLSPAAPLPERVVVIPRTRKEDGGGAFILFVPAERGGRGRLGLLEQLAGVGRRPRRRVVGRLDPAMPWSNLGFHGGAASYGGYWSDGCRFGGGGPRW